MSTKSKAAAAEEKKPITLSSEHVPLSYRIKKDLQRNGMIYAMLIPIRLHLSKEEIRSMAEAETVEQVYSLIKTTWYGRLDTVDPGEGDNPNGLAFHIIDRIYQVTSRKEPYSIAVLNSYLYFKEREIERIITTIERIRYGVAVK